MSTNFAYEVTDPAYERDERPEPDDDEFFPPPDAQPVGRPSASTIAGASMGLHMAVRECMERATKTSSYTERARWLTRMRECQAVLEWLDRGAP